MATRRLVGLVAALAALAFIAPATATAQVEQFEPDHDWTAERPDGIGPVAVLGDRTYAPGELALSYRFMGIVFDGQRTGEMSVPLTTVLDAFAFAPVRQEVTMHLFGLAFGLGDRVTLEAHVPFLMGKMTEHLTEDELRFRNETGFPEDDDRAGFGDVAVRGHLSVYEQGPYRAHATMGVSLPLGSFRQPYRTPDDPDETRAPYSLQIGSGTVDLLPGFTVAAQNDQASTGIQVNTVLRLHENELDYHLGHRFEGSVWGAYQTTDFVSMSVRLLARRWMNVEGADPLLDPMETPAAHPELQGGTRVEMPVGINVFFPEGLLQGHRVGIEASKPIYQDLDGPQLEHGWSLTLGWEYALGG